MYMKKEFGGANGNIDYSDFGGKTTPGERSGSGVKRGGSAKTRGIGTTDVGDSSGYAGTVKDTKFNQVADASGWDH
jgi:hypothetical protein